MALEHVVLQKGVLRNPRIFKAADEERVKDALKAVRRLRGSRYFAAEEGRITWTRPFYRVTFGAIGGLLLSGGVASALGLPPNSPFWFGAEPAWQAAINADPSMAGVLTLEIAGLMMFEGLARNRMDRGRKKKWDRYWKKRNFTNDELIHVFTRENKLDPCYNGGDLFWFKDHKVPKEVIGGYKVKRGNTEELVPHEYTRFVRDGVFHMVIGEEYEPDGKFNAEPRLVKIPPTGLFVGIAVLGPTGSGKSQSVLLPFLDQGAGYYAWIDSERDTWLFEAAANIAKFKRMAMRSSGAKKQEYLEMAKKLQEQHEKWTESIKEGDDPSSGFQKMGIFLVEPKNEMWRDLQNTLKRFNRLKDYIVLGLERQKYAAFSQFSQRLENNTKALWGYAVDTFLVEQCARSLRAFCREFAIPIPADAKSEDLVDLVFGQQDKVSRGEARSLRDTWIPNFYTSVTRRHHFERIMAFQSMNWEGRDPVVGNYARSLMLEGDQVFSPWCFAGGWTDPEEPYVGPFGFGSKNDPWALRYLNPNPNYENAQGYFISTMMAFNRVLGALALRFEELSGSGVLQVAEQKPILTEGSDSGQHGRDTVVAELRRASHGLPTEFDGSESEFKLGNVLVPTIPSSAVLRPPVQEAEEGGSRTQDPKEAARKALKQTANRIKEGLTLAPLSRTEFSKLRKKVRSVAPFAQVPGDWRSEFRIKVKMWHANRRKNLYYFVQELVSALDPQSDRSSVGFRTRIDAVLAHSELQGSLASVVGEVFARQFPLAMVQAISRYILCNSDGRSADDEEDRLPGMLAGEDVIGPLQKRVFDWLCQNGWEYFPKAVLDSQSYDAVAESCLRPTKVLIDTICTKAGIHVEDGFFEDLPGFLSFRAALDQQREQALAAFLLNASRDEFSSPSSLRDMIFVLRREVSRSAIRAWKERKELGRFRGVASKLRRFLEADLDRSGDVLKILGESQILSADPQEFSLEDVASILQVLREDARGRNLMYQVDPKIPTGEAISDDPEDFEAVVDCGPTEVALGPWDSVWSEVVGHNVWEPFRDVARKVLAKAMSHCGAKEVDILRGVAVGDDASSGDLKRILGVVERQLAARRKEVLEESLNYLGQVEDFLRSLSPYYKTNVPFSYGYKDSGTDKAGRPIGIGDCQGTNKYNPVHIPQMTPDQLSGALINSLTKNAGEGDTDVFKNAARKMATNFISILRVAKGYITVSDILQMVSSDPYISLMMDLAERKIQAMEAQQGGVGDAEVLRRQTVLERWREYQGFDPSKEAERADHRGKRDIGEMPAELRWALPRMASESELSEARQLLDKGRSFVINEWRNPKGEFASDEMRGNAKQTFSQLDPLLSGVGSYCFCPDDPEEITFPSWDEIRTKGLCVATRFNMTTDPGLGGLVIGMAIVSYQTTVMTAKEAQTEAKDLFKDVMGGIDRRREELASIRAEIRQLERVVGARLAKRSGVQRFALALLKEARKEAGEKGLSEVEVGRMIVDELFQAEADGRIEGRLGLEHVESLGLKGASEEARTAGRMAFLAGGGQDWEKRVLSEAQVFFRAKVAEVQEREAILRDKVTRLRRRAWVIRQEILNGTSKLEMYPDFSRYMLFVVDEYQMFKNFSKKGGGLSDEVFLSASRAGRSFNVFCTQTPSSVKSGVSHDAFVQWLANILNRICLGAPTKDDAELISDVYGSREQIVEEQTGISVNLGGVDMGVAGEVRASRTEGASKSYNIKKEDVKYVKPVDLMQMRAMSSWVQVTDGQVKLEPRLVYHVPYFLVTSDKVSAITDEPLCNKTWVGLIRDGELDLVPPEDENLRHLMEFLQATGVEMDDEIKALEARKKDSEAEGA